MPRWWNLVLSLFGQASARHAPAESVLLAEAEEFLRASRNNYDLPDQTAINKAMALLHDALAPQQRADLVTRGYFYVEGKRFTYRIRHGLAANVDALDSSGCVISRLCAHPLGHSPIYDVMLAQKLWIETDEDMFLRRAARRPPV